MEGCGNDRLQAALAPAGHDERMAVPIGTLGQILRSPKTRKIHPQEVALLTVVVSNRGVIVERAAGLILVERLRLIDWQIVCVDVENQPTFGGPAQYPGFLQGVDARPLHDEHRRQSVALPGRASWPRMCEPRMLSMVILK